MDDGICEGSNMVSCVVRGLSRSMVGGASLSYRHMIRLWGFLERNVLNVYICPLNCSRAQGLCLVRDTYLHLPRQLNVDLEAAAYTTVFFFCLYNSRAKIWVYRLP